MLTLYLVRHGESEMNVANTLSYKLADGPLTEKGLQQARRVAQRLADHQLDCIYTSPLQRARQTAHCIAEQTGAPVQVVEALREIDCGILDGRGDEEALAITREVDRRWEAGEWDVPFPGGETCHQLYDRLSSALNSLVEAHLEGNVAVVGHAGLFGFALPRFCGRQFESLASLPNTSVTVLHHHEGQVTCSLWGCVAHLEPVAIIDVSAE
jgi:probable phosphoglycerate mutase